MMAAANGDLVESDRGRKFEAAGAFEDDEEVGRVGGDGEEFVDELASARGGVGQAEGLVQR